MTALTDAALEAMAGALHGRWKDEGCVHVGKWRQCVVDAKCALAALVASEDVQEWARDLYMDGWHATAPDSWGGVAAALDELWPRNSHLAGKKGPT